jgi:hypothetical protein
VRFTKSHYISAQDFEIDGEFVNRGAMDALGADWLALLQEMNQALLV